MKKLFLLFTIIVLVFAGCSIRPAKPTQEWCKWAFNQIPDHKDISEIDSTAFSAEFYGLLKDAYKAMDREIEMYPGMLGDYEFLFYWYDGSGVVVVDVPTLVLTSLNWVASNGSSMVALMMLL